MAENLTKVSIVSIVRDAIEAYIEESVTHFLKASFYNRKEEGRYLYTTKELLQFYTLYTSKGGDTDLLHCGIVYDDAHDFLCYEVCRKTIYDSNREYFFS